MTGALLRENSSDVDPKNKITEPHIKAGLVQDSLVFCVAAYWKASYTVRGYSIFFSASMSSEMIRTLSGP